MDPKAAQRAKTPQDRINPGPLQEACLCFATPRGNKWDASTSMVDEGDTPAESDERLP